MGVCGKYFSRIAYCNKNNIANHSIYQIFFLNFSGEKAICQLKISLENIGGLGRAGRAVLVTAVTRLVFHSLQKGFRSNLIL